jgi:hypothetical protein
MTVAIFTTFAYFLLTDHNFSTAGPRVLHAIDHENEYYRFRPDYEITDGLFLIQPCKIIGRYSIESGVSVCIKKDAVIRVYSTILLHFVVEQPRSRRLQVHQDK